VFGIEAQNVTDISPKVVPQFGGTLIVMSGQNLVGNYSASIDGVVMLSWVTGSAMLVVPTALNIGTYDLVLSFNTSQGQHLVVPGAITYYASMFYFSHKTEQWILTS